MRASPEDFRVEEALSFLPTGEGEHVYLKVEKKELNTDEVARQIARLAGARPADVGYAGLKDRHACTRQWFSVRPAAGMAIEWAGQAGPGWRVLECTRHIRKLRRGAIAHNAFELVIRELDAPVARLVDRLERIQAAGVPNYFGPQRFGRDGGNLEQARALLAGDIRVRDRHRRGLYLSAARSELFNAVCAARVRAANWDLAIEGDVLMLDGSRSVFVIDAPDAGIAARVAELDVHPAGPLPGLGGLAARGAALALERAVLAAYEDLERGLAGFGLEQDRRALRLPVRGLTWVALDSRTLQLGFQLPPGGYATTVVRELIEYRSGTARP